MRRDLVAQARACGLTREDAEDVASEAVLRAATKDDLDLERAAGWLRVVTRRLAIDTFRRRERARATEAKRAYDAPHIPQDRVDDRLEAEWVAGLVDALPERQRFVLQRRAEEATPEAIAISLGCSYKTVESLTSRGRAAVRSALTSTFGLGAGWILPARRLLRTGGLPTGVAVASLPLVSTSILGLLQPTMPTLAPTSHILPFAGTGAHEAVPHVPDRRSVGPAQVTSGPPVEGAGTVPVASSSTTTRILAPQHVGVVAHGGLATTRKRDDESFLETVRRCVEELPTLTTTTVGCT